MGKFVVALLLAGAALGTAQTPPRLRLRGPYRLRDSSNGPYEVNESVTNGAPEAGAWWAPTVEARATDDAQSAAAAAADGATGQEAPLFRPTGERGCL